MKRCLLIILTLLSLLLGFAATALWVRSLWYPDIWRIASRPNSTWFLVSGRGTLRLVEQGVNHSRSPHRRQVPPALSNTSRSSGASSLWSAVTCHSFPRGTCPEHGLLVPGSTFWHSSLAAPPPGMDNPPRMGRYYRELSPEHIEFIRAQRIFFVATAPSGAAGRVNLSPNGYKSLQVIDPRTVAYVDYPGSGNETANHVRENGRLTFMWCSFEGKALILRTYGAAKVIEKTASEFADLMARHFPRIPIRTTRQLIVQSIEAVQTSCGSGVPLYEYQGEREAMRKWMEGQADNGTLDDYIRDNASRSEEKFPLQG